MNINLIVLLYLTSTVLGQTLEQIQSTPTSTRRGWCQLQVAQCKTMCAQTTFQNSCNVRTLQFTCVCGDGRRLDNDTSIDLPMPYYKCITYFQQPCIQACPIGDQACTDACNEKYKCGNVVRNASIPLPPPNSPLTATVLPQGDVNGAGYFIDLNSSSAKGVFKPCISACVSSMLIVLFAALSGV